MNKFEKNFSEKISSELEEFSSNLKKDIIACITKQLNGAVIDVIKTNNNSSSQETHSETLFDTQQIGKRSKSYFRNVFL